MRMFIYALVSLALWPLAVAILALGFVILALSAPPIVFQSLREKHQQAISGGRDEDS